MKFFKQLFCKHEWKCIKETFQYVIFKCIKCDKEKTYWN